MSIITKELAESRMCTHPYEKTACCVSDLSQIVDQMEKNHTLTMKLLDLLVKTVVDQSSLNTAKHIAETYRDAGIMSGLLCEHICHRLEIIIHPENQKEATEDQSDFSSNEEIDKYIVSADRHTLKYFVVGEAYSNVEYLRNLELAERNVDGYVTLGDMPENIAVLTKVFFENIYNFKSNDYHEYAKQLGLLDDDTK